jgi:hypothetical protein
VEAGAKALAQAYGHLPVDGVQVLVVPTGPGREPVPWGQVMRCTCSSARPVPWRNSWRTGPSTMSSATCSTPGSRGRIAGSRRGWPATTRTSCRPAAGP